MGLALSGFSAVGCAKNGGVWRPWGRIGRLRHYRFDPPALGIDQGANSAGRSAMIWAPVHAVEIVVRAAQSFGGEKLALDGIDIDLNRLHFPETPLGLGRCALMVMAGVHRKKTIPWSGWKFGRLAQQVVIFQYRGELSRGGAAGVPCGYGLTCPVRSAGWAICRRPASSIQ
jgi:hypothetical protein